MRFGKLGSWVCAAAGIAAVLTVAQGQVSTPGPSGPIIQDRMIYFEAALMQLDQRLRVAEVQIKSKDADLAKLSKDLQAAKEKEAALEKRVAGLENAIKKLGVGIERGSASPSSR